MGVKFSSADRNCINRKTDSNRVLPGMTLIICQRCGRKLGQVFSTNGVVICDKCGYRSYTRIYGGAVVTLPASYLQYEGYYDDADDYIHKVRDRINRDQVLIKDPVFEVD